VTHDLEAGIDPPEPGQAQAEVPETAGSDDGEDRTVRTALGDDATVVADAGARGDRASGEETSGDETFGDQWPGHGAGQGGDPGDVEIASSAGGDEQEAADRVAEDPGGAGHIGDAVDTGHVGDQSAADADDGVAQAGIAVHGWALGVGDHGRTATGGGSTDSAGDEGGSLAPDDEPTDVAIPLAGAFGGGGDTTGFADLVGGATGPPQTGSSSVVQDTSTAMSPSELRLDFGAHLEANYQRLVAQMYAITLSADEAHSVVQDAYSRAWRNWSVIGRTADPTGWVRGVAVRTTMRSWRHLLARLGFARATPGVAAGLDERTTALLTALRELPAPERRSVVLCHMAGLSPGEIAAVEQVPPSTISTRLERARRSVLGDNAHLLADVIELPGLVLGGDRGYADQMSAPAQASSPLDERWERAESWNGGPDGSWMVSAAPPWDAPNSDEWPHHRPVPVENDPPTDGGDTGVTGDLVAGGPVGEEDTVYLDPGYVDGVFEGGTSGGESATGREDGIDPDAGDDAGDVLAGGADGGGVPGPSGAWAGVDEQPRDDGAAGVDVGEGSPPEGSPPEESSLPEGGPPEGGADTGHRDSEDER